MKKLLMIALAVAMVLITAIPCFAANDADVKVNYGAEGEAAAVYSVNVTFGTMAFVYTDASFWDPETNEFLGTDVEGTWSCAEGANVVTVSNHSNAAVAVTVTYNAAQGFDAITGTVENGSFTLPSAEGKAVDAAELTATATLTLSGELASTTEANSVAGTLTVAFVAA